MTNRTTRRTAVLLTGLLSLGIGLTGGIHAASADIDDLGTCQPVDVDDHHCDTPAPDPDPAVDTDVDDLGICQPVDVDDHHCDDPDDGGDDGGEDPGTDDPGTDVDDGTLPPAPVGDVVVADPNFTG
jgi:hypothetical protein